MAPHEHGPHERFAGRSIPDPGFADDDGSADPALHAALAAAGHEPVTSDAAEAVSRALAGARLLVPVVAILTEEEAVAPGELRREKGSEMAVPTITGARGRRALPAFTSTEALALWRADARPVAVEARRAALATYAEEADTLLLDMAGPVPHEVTGARLRALAEGREYVAPGRDDELAALVREAVSAEPDVGAAYLAAGDETDLTLGLVPADGRGPADVAEAARRVAGRLAGEDLVRERLPHGLDLALFTPGALPPGAREILARRA